jgi:amino acid adenylation domain-containing protein
VSPADLPELVAPLLAPGGDGRDALKSASAALTYAELRAAVLAARETLRRSGVGPGDRVALCCPRGLAGIVALLAVVAAGAAYAPLDPALSEAALARMLGDLQPALLIVSQAERAGPQTPARRALIDPKTLALTVEDGAAGPDKSGADLAALFYTSGSTGAPKGIMLSHAALAAFVDWGARSFALRPDDALINHAPLHFDLSVFDVFAGLGARASVRVLDDAEVMFPGAVRRAVLTCGATSWYSAPTALARLAERGALTGVTTLRRVLFAGEVFPSPILRRLMLDLPGVEFANLFGPAETNVCAFHRLPEPPGAEEPVPIGRACDHCELRLLDEAGRDVAEGETGEICVAGPSVMQGYWRRPDATAAARLPDWRPDSYRTGDFAYRRGDGLLMFVGRRDAQVKVRGRRLELLALEGALAAHPQVEAAAALVCGGALVAFLASRRERPALSEIVGFALDRLPPQYAPDEIVWLERLPLLSNGKCDREALRALAPQGAG